MSPNSLENPFHPPEQQTGIPSKLTEVFLDPATNTALTEALGEDEPSKSEPQQDLLPADISMTGEEQREVEKESYWTREQYIEWAESFGKDENWVDGTFEFQKDGTTVVWGNLNLLSTEIKQLPVGLMEVKGKLIIDINPSLKLNGYPKKVSGYFGCSYNNILSLEGMPEEVGGGISFEESNLTSLVGLPKIINNNLNLSWNKFVTLDDFPREIHGDVRLSDNENLVSLDVLSGVKIGGDLWLRDIPATTIPAGIEIGGDILINSSHADLIADAKKKGYQVKIL